MEKSRFWNGISTGDAALEAPYDANTEFANWVKQSIGLGGTRADSGVVLGNGSGQLDSLQVTQNSPAGMSVLLNIGTALVDGTTYENDAALTLSISSNASGNPRIDTVILRKSWAGQTVRAVVLAGTPAASPVPPTLTQSAGVTWEIPIADIAVANGAVSITTSNITPRATFTDAADRVMLDRLLNNSGATLSTGDVVGIDSSADRAVTTTNATALTRLQRLGVWNGRVAAAGVGRVTSSGITRVRTSAAVTRGQYCNVDVAAATCSGSTLPTVNTIGEFLETTSGAGLALAWIDVRIPQQFALLASTELAAPAAGIAFTLNSPYNTIEVEFNLRSVIAATNENALLGFHAASIAANYFSYVANISNSTPAVTAVQNLGVTANIPFNIPGSTAPANVFAYGRFILSQAARNPAAHHISGYYHYRVGNANGNLAVVQIGGWYSNSNAIGNLAFATAGGNNFDTGSYVNIYGKQTL